MYTAVSSLQTHYDEPLSHTGRKLDTALPAGRNPRSFALAQQLRTASSSDRQYAQSVLAHFQSIGLRYTLEPPLLGQDSVDDLLFDTRLGFCGHFASAYVTLMRAAGIPARVVTGYMGGEWNPIGGYYVIRQSDAHAWAEVWLDGNGWTRIDPTAVVEPERLQQGLRDLLPGSGGAADRLLRSASWLRQLRNTWDAASNFWQERVVNFNLSTQLDLLGKLGLGGLDYRGMALLLLAGAAVWGAVIWYRSRSPGPPPPDALSGIWARFEALLRKRGLAIDSHEGPRHIATRAARRFPDSAADILRFVDHYVQLRFGPASASVDTGKQRVDISLLRLLLQRIARATATGHHPRTAATAPE